MDENSSNTSSPPNNNARGRTTGIDFAINYMFSNKITALLWLTRMGTIIFTVLAIIPLFDTKFYSSYQRALLCNAATSALRLHQRLPAVRLTREFLVTLRYEDSCHYLLYSLLFIYSYPITMALQPIFLFACLHSAAYTAALCEKLGFTNCTESLKQTIDRQQRNILKFEALSEICLFPLTVFAIFSGKGSLLTPFAYYRFILLRYTSRRNPYTRTVFHELRLSIENFANTPGRSVGIRNFCFKIIGMVSMLAPAVIVQ